MSAWNPRANAIFVEAIEIPDPERRRAYVGRACDGEAGLRAQVDALLGAHDHAGGFLAAPAATPTVTAGTPPEGEGPGSVIGPYKLLEPIGEGGMGTVFMAEQVRPVRRRVALKLIKPGMDSKQVIARFEAERQALALMDHPNIAKVLDAGATEQGRPYFVMELVRGVPITEYCDRERLPIRERLELFAQICRAVQHAHQKGVIHRDLKPSNILVTLHDGVPVPKVIDFGIAKATGQALTDRTLFTGFAQLVGTPLYMSPEQAEMSGLDVDTRSDLYSLGVLLYELLTGTTPFDKDTLRRAAFDEVRRIIREHEPPRPSTRLSGLGATLTTVSAQRGSDPQRLGRLVRGELDWIVMKALEKDRRRRYETADALAADVRNYLADAPVAACPPSAGYRFGKFARRHRAGLATGAVVASALVLGLAASLWQAVRASRAERVTAEALRLAERQRLRAEGHFRSARTAVEEMLTKVASERLNGFPKVDEVRRDLLEDALRFYKGFLREEGTDPAIRYETAQAYVRVGEILRWLGRTEAQPFRRAIGLLEALVAENPGKPEYRKALADACTQFSQSGSDGPRESGVLARRAVSILGSLAEEHPQDRNLTLSLAAAVAALADSSHTEGRFGEAERLYRRAIDLNERLIARGEAEPSVRRNSGLVYTKLGTLLGNTGRDAEALEPLERALALAEALSAELPSDPEYRQDLASALNVRAKALKGAGRPVEAERDYRRAIGLLKELSAESPSVLRHRWALIDTTSGLERLLTGRGRAKESEQILRMALPVAEGLVRERRDSEQYQAALSQIVHQLGEVVSPGPEGEALHRRSIDIDEGLVAAHPDRPIFRLTLAEHCDCLAQLLRGSGRLAEAEPFGCRAIGLLEPLTAEFDAPHVRSRAGAGLHNHALALMDRGEFEEAERLLRRAIGHQLKALATSPRDPTYRERLGKHQQNLLHILTTRLGAHAEAARAAEGLIPDDPQRGGVDHQAAAEVLMECIALAGRDATLSPGERAAAARAYAERAKVMLRQAADELGDDLTRRQALVGTLANCPDPQFRDPPRAIELARRAVEEAPGDALSWKLLGIAHYRTGSWTESLAAIEKCQQVLGGLEPTAAVFAIMARWRLDERERALRDWGELGARMDQEEFRNEEILRARTEAEALILDGGFPTDPFAAGNR